MNTQTLFIKFNHHYLTVKTNSIIITAGLIDNFQQMLISQPTGSMLGQLRVWQNGETFTILEQGKIIVENLSPAETLRQLRDEIVLRFIKATPGLLWLHAGVAGIKNRAVVIAGVSSQGKSTLVTNLYNLGWTYFSDDVTPFDPSSGQVYPFPETPMVRMNPGYAVSGQAAILLNKNKMRLKSDRVGQEAASIMAVIFPIFDFTATTWLDLCSPAMATLELLQNLLNFIHHREAAVDSLCQLVAQTPTYRLIYSDGGQAAEFLNQYYLNSNASEVAYGLSFFEPARQLQ